MHQTTKRNMANDSIDTWYRCPVCDSFIPKNYLGTRIVQTQCNHLAYSCPVCGENNDIINWSKKQKKSKNKKLTIAGTFTYKPYRIEKMFLLNREHPLGVINSKNEVVYADGKTTAKQTLSNKTHCAYQVPYNDKILFGQESQILEYSTKFKNITKLSVPDKLVPIFITMVENGKKLIVLTKDHNFLIYDLSIWLKKPTKIASQDCIVSIDSKFGEIVYCTIDKLKITDCITSNAIKVLETKKATTSFYESVKYSCGKDAVIGAQIQFTDKDGKTRQKIEFWGTETSSDEYGNVKEHHKKINRSIFINEGFTLLNFQFDEKYAILYTKKDNNNTQGFIYVYNINDIKLICGTSVTAEVNATSFSPNLLFTNINDKEVIIAQTSSTDILTISIDDAPIENKSKKKYKKLKDIIYRSKEALDNVVSTINGFTDDLCEQYGIDPVDLENISAENNFFDAISTLETILDESTKLEQIKNKLNEKYDEEEFAHYNFKEVEEKPFVYEVKITPVDENEKNLNYVKMCDVKVEKYTQKENNHWGKTSKLFPGKLVQLYERQQEQKKPTSIGRLKKSTNIVIGGAKGRMERWEIDVLNEFGNRVRTIMSYVNDFNIIDDTILKDITTAEDDGHCPNCNGFILFQPNNEDRMCRCNNYDKCY